MSSRPRLLSVVFAGLLPLLPAAESASAEKSNESRSTRQATVEQDPPTARPANPTDPAPIAPAAPRAPKPLKPTKSKPSDQNKDSDKDSGRRWMTNLKGKPTGIHIALPEGFEHSDILLARGDDDRWAQPGWDDSQWEVITHAGLPAHTGVYWIRYRVRGPTRLPGSIAQKVGAAFELYWDGRLVGRSGEPADRAEEEEPGKLDTRFTIPAEWLLPEGKQLSRKITKEWNMSDARSEHVVAMRMSNHLYGFPGPRTDLHVSYLAPDRQANEVQQNVVETALAAGAMSMVALAGLTLWLVALRRSLLLLFTGLCACAAVTQFMAMARFAGSYNYDWHYLFRLSMIYLATGLGACLIAFVGMHFKVPRLRWLLGGHLLLAAGILVWPREIYHLPLSDRPAIVMLVAFLLSAATAGWAAWRGDRGALLVLAGCLLSALTGGPFLEGGFFHAFLPTMLGLLGAVALRLRAEAEAAQEAHLTATRLEVELLKKNLQPHFLLNSLTALAEVVERDPTVASKLIGDLAGVFRSLARMSGEKQVSLAQELELCRTHLRVMSVRTGVDWRLETHNVGPESAVPPALFLTLIENGYIHQRVKGDTATFELSAEPRPGGTAYTFISPGEIKVQPDRPDGGTGLRYVKARLEESFPGRWTFAHGPHPAGGWATVIELWRRGHARPA